MSNRSLMICLTFLLLCACSNYDFTINERVVYTPDPLFEGFDVPDEALRQCIQQAIERNKVTSASALFSLNCAGAGVKNLTGLSTFTELEQLTLSANDITDIQELGSLSVLQTIYLDDNRITDAVPLYQLPALQWLDISHNPDLICPRTGSLLRVSNVTLPRHCR